MCKRCSKTCSQETKLSLTTFFVPGLFQSSVSTLGLFHLQMNQGYLAAYSKLSDLHRASIPVVRTLFDSIHYSNGCDIPSNAQNWRLAEKCTYCHYAKELLSNSFFIRLWTRSIHSSDILHKTFLQARNVFAIHWTTIFSEILYSLHTYNTKWVHFWNFLWTALLIVLPTEIKDAALWKQRKNANKGYPKTCTKCMHCEIPILPGVSDSKKLSDCFHS